MMDNEKAPGWQLFRIVSISANGTVDPAGGNHHYFVGKLPQTKDGAFTDCAHLCSGDRAGETVKVPLTFNAGMFVEDDGSIGLRLHLDDKSWDQAMRRMHHAPDCETDTIIFGYKVSPDEMQALRN